MIGRARTNHRAEIEDQFFILSQMIDEISAHFQEGKHELEQIAKEDATIQSDGEKAIYSSVHSSYAYEIERRDAMCAQSRQILFCAIYAYYEAMLNRLISYYDISITNNNDLNDAKSMIKAICTDFLLRSKHKLSITDVEFINDYCRLLRNHFMHGVLSRKKKREELKQLSDKYGGIIYNEYYATIEDDSFIKNVLKTILKRF